MKLVAHLLVSTVLRSFICGNKLSHSQRLSDLQMASSILLCSVSELGHSKTGEPEAVEESLCFSGSESLLCMSEVIHESAEQARLGGIFNVAFTESFLSTEEVTSSLGLC